MSDGPQKMQKPQWKYEVNLNSILQVITLVGFVAAWSSTWTSMREGQKKNADAIEEMKKDIGAINASIVEIPQLRYRITSLEAGQKDLSVNQKDYERTINSLASDIRVTREIVHRLDLAWNSQDR